MGETEETKETPIPNCVAIGNQKGGAGKTTDTIHLAGALADRGYRVLCVDMDYHGGLTCSLGFEDLYYELDRDHVSLFELLQDPERLNAETLEENLRTIDEFDILASTERLANSSNVQELSNAPRSTERLNMLLTRLHQLTEYDYVLIDTPPALNILVVSQSPLEFCCRAI